MPRPPRPPTASSTSRRRPSSGPTSATTSRFPPTRCSIRSCRATWRVTARRLTWWPTASPRPWSIWWSGWSTEPSTSGVRCRPGYVSRPRPSARTAACPSPTATAPPRPPRPPNPASPTVPEGPLPPDVTWRTIDQLAGRVGGYCWWEHRLFELTGGWASGTGDPEIRVLFSQMSPRHAAVSLQWRDRLPARAGVDVTALVVAPNRADVDALTLLDGQSDDLLRLGGLIEVVLPRLHSAYRAHLRQASAV